MSGNIAWWSWTSRHSKRKRFVHSIVEMMFPLLLVDEAADFHVENVTIRLFIVDEDVSTAVSTQNPNDRPWRIIGDGMHSMLGMIIDLHSLSHRIKIGEV